MTQEVKLKRAECNYQLENSRFLLECDFSKQYCNYYKKRLEKTKPFLEFNCRIKWDSSIPIYSLSQLASICDTNLDQVFSPSPLSVSSNEQTPQKETYNLPKRLRKYSGSSSESSPLPSTSNVFPLISTPDASVSKRDLTKFNSPGLEQLRSPIFSNISLRNDHCQIHENQALSQVPLGLCIIIGTIFKRMKLQPDVLQELCHGEFYINCERYLGHYLSQDDKLILEDSDESISLTGEIDSSKLVTGINVALLGQPIDECCKFLVRDICYAEPNRMLLYEEETLIRLDSSREQNIERPLMKVEDDKPLYLLVLSGLEFHQDMDKGSLMTIALQNIIDFIWGGGRYSEDERCSRVSRILIVGNNLLQERLDVSSSSQNNVDPATKLKQSRQVKPYTNSIKAISHLDDFFAELSKTINVDVMPGASDPTSHLLPQQPFHPCMFPKSSLFSTFNCVTNPHRAVYNSNVDLLATSGQNVDIVDKFSGISDSIEIMKCHLKWGNMAPSAPDNLYSVPYENDDPMIIDFIPEIYIAGCQDYYRTSRYKYESQQNSSQQNVSTDTTISSKSSGETSNTLEEIDNTSPANPITPHHNSLQNVNDQHASRPQPSSSSSNCYQLGSKTVTKLITVPKFIETLSCVLINLKTLKSELLSFNN